MIVDLSEKSIDYVIDGLRQLQLEKTKQYSNALSICDNPNDIIVCTCARELLNVSNLLALFMRKVEQ